MLAAGAVGAGAVEYGHRAHETSPAEPSLTVPAEVHGRAGEPLEVAATTTGRRVVWLSLDPELALKPAGPKSVWAWAAHPGRYRVIAWSAAGDTPTTNVNAVVVIDDDGKGGSK